MAKAKKNFSQQVGGILSASLETDPLLTGDPLGNKDSGINVALSVLTDTEISRLKTLEETIERGLITFLEVGNALLEIQEGKLYRDSHATFEGYMNDRFKLKRKRGYQLIDAAKVINQIAAELETQTAPESGSETEGYQAVPTGKVKRPKPTQNDVQPVDVEYVDQPSFETPERVENEQLGKPTEPTSLVAQEGTRAQKKNGDRQEPSKSIPLPETESHAAALSSIPEEKRTEVWKEAVNDSGKTGKPVTAKSIKQAGERVGIPHNKKATADRKAPKNVFSKNSEPDNDLSDGTLESTRQAMDSGWISEDEPATLDSAEFGAVDQLGTTEAKQSNSGLREKILSALPGEIVVTIEGSFLVRQGLAEKWQRLRGDDREINGDYTDKLSIQALFDLIDL